MPEFSMIFRKDARGWHVQLLADERKLGDELGPYPSEEEAAIACHVVIERKIGQMVKNKLGLR